jgi:hypothetical protein
MLPQLQLLALMLLGQMRSNSHSSKSSSRLVGRLRQQTLPTQQRLQQPQQQQGLGRTLMTSQRQHCCCLLQDSLLHPRLSPLHRRVRRGLRQQQHQQLQTPTHLMQQQGQWRQVEVLAQSRQASRQTQATLVQPQLPQQGSRQRQGQRQGQQRHLQPPLPQQQQQLRVRAVQRTVRLLSWPPWP